MITNLENRKQLQDMYEKYLVLYPKANKYDIARMLHLKHNIIFGKTKKRYTLSSIYDSIRKRKK